MLIVVFDYTSYDRLDLLPKEAHRRQVALVSLWVMPVDSLNEQQIVGVLFNIQT